MSENIDTKKSTCLLCDSEVDPKSEIRICSTCAIVAMSDEDFQKQYYISFLEDVNLKPITEIERKDSRFVYSCTRRTSYREY
jgi:hypothetical protein